MNPPREIKGFWWSPAQPESRWFGTLTLGPDRRPTLEAFTEPTDLLWGGPSRGIA
jgi:hypothetical protein